MKFASVGLGGYAATAWQTLLRSSALDCVYEPDLPSYPHAADQLQRQGVRLFSRYQDLLAQPVDALWLPLPIHLHRSFTEQALAAGKAVLCEKPAAGCLDDVDAMLAARNRFRQPLAIAFQHLFDPAVHQAKRSLLAGDIGTLSSATLHACWPRDDLYYRRNSWAGSIQRNHTWVLDSPANNALAHYLNLALFLLGPAPAASAIPHAIEAELYRANPIENYDTCSFRLHLPLAPPLLVLFTHACSGTIQPTLTLTGRHGQLRFIHDHGIEITTPRHRQTLPQHPDLLLQMLRSFTTWLQTGTGPVATLEIARAHALAVSAASDAAPVHSIHPQFIHTSTPAPLRTLPGIEDLFQRCADSNLMLHESSLAPWSHPPGRLNLQHYSRFHATFFPSGKLQ